MSIVACPKCGAKNRVDESLAEVQPVCGRCGTKLSTPHGPITLTDQSFDAVIRDAGSIPILVDCWAPWCGPCRALGPTIDAIAAESNGRYQVAKLNTEEHQMIAARYRIDAIPCMLIFKNGQLIDRLVGMQPKPAILQRLLAAGTP